MKILSIFVLTADQKFSIIELIKIHPGGDRICQDKLRQELEKIRKSISDHEEKIAALKEKEKEVLDQIHDAEMESIRQTMEEKGLDVDALKKILDCYEADSSKDEAN